LNPRFAELKTLANIAAKALKAIENVDGIFDRFQKNLFFDLILKASVTAR
jgi:hypothetical protein